MGVPSAVLKKGPERSRLPVEIPESESFWRDKLRDLLTAKGVAPESSTLGFEQERGIAAPSVR